MRSEYLNLLKGNVSDDPRVEEEFRQDRKFEIVFSPFDDMLICDFTSALTYKGKLRASTGLSLLHGLNQLASRAEEIKLRKSQALHYSSRF